MGRKDIVGVNEIDGFELMVGISVGELDGWKRVVGWMVIVGWKDAVGWKEILGS